MKTALSQKKIDYWRSRMEAGYEFMMEILHYPVCESHEKLVFIPDYAKKTGVKMFFSKKKRTSVSFPLFYLREGIIENLLWAADKMNSRDWAIKVEDAFRTTQMQNPLNRNKEVLNSVIKTILWETNGKIPEPEFVFRRLTVLIATIPKIGTHMSGSAVDISVISLKTGNEIDRGADYLEMNEKTFMDSPFVSLRARKNRQTITQIMEESGFFAYPYEFWHYSSKDAYAQYLSKSGMPGIYGPVDLIDKSGAIKPIENPEKPLFPIEKIKEKINEFIKK